MKSDGTNSVTASSFGTPTGTGIPNIVFNGSETNYNTFPADTTWYIQVTKGGLASNIKTSGKSFTKDPTLSAITRSGGDYNSAFGFQALYTNVDGHSNTSIGYQSLHLNTTGAYNTAVGYAALYSNQTVANNTAVGYKALWANTTAINNTSVGFKALEDNTTGQNNNAIGVES